MKLRRAVFEFSLYVLIRGDATSPFSVLPAQRIWPTNEKQPSRVCVCVCVCVFVCVSFINTNKKKEIRWAKISQKVVYSGFTTEEEMANCIKAAQNYRRVLN